MSSDEVPDLSALIIAESDSVERPEVQHPSPEIRYSIDEYVTSEAGGVLVTGWVADAEAPLETIELEGSGGRHVFAGEHLRRRPRFDVSGALHDESGYAFGFWGYQGAPAAIAVDGDLVRMRLTFADGSHVNHAIAARSVDALHLPRQGLVFAAIGTEHEPTIRATRGAEWMRWLQTGPEMARFVAACGAGFGDAIRAIGLRNAIEPDRARALPDSAERPLSWSIDTIVFSEGGGLFVVGWLDDTEDPVAALRISGPGWQALVEGRALARIRREDVEGVLQKGGRHCYGFWTFLFSGQKLSGRGGCRVELLSNGGRTQMLDVPAPSCLSSAELRSVVLTYLANSRHFGAPQVEKIGQLSRVIGGQLVAFNRFISRSVVRAPHVQRFVTPGRRPRASIVICLYGKPEYLFVQAALFCNRPGMEDYEFIYVSNSPELAETLLNEARNVRRIYGQELTLVLLPANAGFGAANNAAVQHARSDRVLIVNPDVFPKDMDWAARHTEFVESGRPGSRLFGVPLYYDDGSLMHGGMFFELDTGLSVMPEGVDSQRMARVEHYGKGAPPMATQFLAARPVPAVTGAFISCERAWFEALGGFTEDYVFGHYEDADLCLKSFERGVPAWLQDFRLWHLEGKGSLRLNAHEGGSLVNRWLFSDRWGELLQDGLLGPTPSHKLLQPPPAAEPMVVPPSAPAPDLAGAPARGMRRGARARDEKVTRP